MDISSFDKSQVLAALYNRARAQGMGLIHYTPANMTQDEAQTLLDGGQTYFDYHKGRVMKVSLADNELDTHLYNRDNGIGAAEEAINSI